LMSYLNPEAESETSEESESEDPFVEETPKSTYSEPAPKKKSNFDEDEFDSLFND